jgi:tRNA (cytidine/uridine-2'-O-)-methyltransferase
VAVPDLTNASSKPILHIALVEPEIAPNVGNVARLAAAVGARLHLIGRLGFRLDDRRLRRAGLDYWPHVDLARHDHWSAFLADLPLLRRIAIESTAPASYSAFAFRVGDCLVFGSESKGLAQEVQAQCQAVLRVPMPGGRVRSLNLANTVAIVAYEGLRQFGAL